MSAARRSSSTSREGRPWPVGRADDRDPRARGQEGGDGRLVEERDGSAALLEVEHRGAGARSLALLRQFASLS